MTIPIYFIYIFDNLIYYTIKYDHTYPQCLLQLSQCFPIIPSHNFVIEY